MLKYNWYSLPHLLFRYNTELVGSSKKGKRAAHDLNPMFRLMLSETSGCLVTDNGETTSRGMFLPTPLKRQAHLYTPLTSALMTSRLA